MLILFVYGIGNLLETQDNIYQVDDIQDIYCTITVQVSAGILAIAKATVCHINNIQDVYNAI